MNRLTAFLIAVASTVNLVVSIGVISLDVLPEGFNPMRAVVAVSAMLAIATLCLCTLVIVAPPVPRKGECPSINSLWIHKSGTVYIVTGYCNVRSTEFTRYPLTIRYCEYSQFKRIGYDPNNDWCRPLYRWEDSMTPYDTVAIIENSGEGDEHSRFNGTQDTER